MAYTARQLITGAYYAAGIVSREFETVSGQQAADGLIWLNNIITETNVADGMIPYELTYSFTALPGQERYFVPGLVDVDTLVFYLNNVRFAMQYEKRNAYFGSPRVENITSLPFEWYFERCLGGGNIYIYFQPDQAYPMEVHGAFELAPVTEFQDLENIVTTADLGVPTLLGNGTLLPLQLVVNNIDLFGNYATIGALVNYINTGIVPGVTASIVVNDFVLTSTTQPPISIYVRSSGLIGGISTKGAVASASTADLNATYANGTLGVGATLTNAGAFAAFTLDGVAGVVGQRVLIKNQTAPAQNGIYIVTIVGDGASINWELTRATNYDTSDEVQPGNIVTVTGGTTQDDTAWYQTEVVINMGTDAIEFIAYSNITFSQFNTQSNPLYEIFNPSGLDQFYITYLRYALANRICAEYNEVTPPNVKEQMEYYASLINKKSKVMDLQLKKKSTLGRRDQSYSWQYINLGRGYTPYN